MAHPFPRVLFVCLGNICRSPTAEGVLRHLVTHEVPLLKVEIDSAGTADYHIGQAPDPRSQQAALGRGIDISGLRARQVRTADFSDFDLILAMDRDNLRALESLRPAGSRAKLQLLLDYLGPAPNPREVPDPYYGGVAQFDRVLDLVTAACRGLIASLQKCSEQPVQSARERDGHR